MSAAAQPPSRHWFRDREAALKNSAVLSWVAVGWLTSFALMGASFWLLNLMGVLVCAQTMVLAAYLVHEAAHQTLFSLTSANVLAGEAMSFVAGSSYASFERIRHLHVRHHRERADVACFDFKRFMQGRPIVRRALQALEWCYVPAIEWLMHLQVIFRPLVSISQRRHLPRSAAMLVARVGLLALIGLWSMKALLLYCLAVAIRLQVLNFFDAFHHTFEQYVVAADEPVPLEGRDRAYEQANTYSNLVSVRFPWLNLLTLNFGYHNAHHQRASVPWYRLPRQHRSLYGDGLAAVMPLSELWRSWCRHRVRRMGADDYGLPGEGADRAATFIGAHGVSFLTVV